MLARAATVLPADVSDQMVSTFKQIGTQIANLHISH